MQDSRQLIRNYFFFLSLATLCILLVTGCSGSNDPVSPNLEGSGALEDVWLINDDEVPDYVEGEVLVVLHDTCIQSDALSLLQSQPVRLARTSPLSWGTIHNVVITDGTSVETMCERLLADPRVKYAEPNYIIRSLEAPYWPNDPMWDSDDPGIDPRDNYDDQWGPSRMGADIVWNETKGSEDIIVAVSDTGVWFDHEDLIDNIWINEDEIPDNDFDDDQNGYIDDWWGWDALNNDNDPYDDNNYVWHGTACAGIVAAIQDNNKGCTGMAPNVRIMALKSLGEDGYGSFAALAVTVDYAVNNGADIISLSLGAKSGGPIIDEVFENSWANGVVTVAAAGNDDEIPVIYPACVTSVIAIGATVPFAKDGTTVDEQRIGDDGVDHGWGSNYGDLLSVMGYSTSYVTTSGGADNYYKGYYDGVYRPGFSGTSCATPTVAGTLALLMSWLPGQEAQWYRDRIEQTADDLDEPGYDIQTGYGRVNAIRAVFGPDRFRGDEDIDGFLVLPMPSAQVYDSIHNLVGPYLDNADLYRFTIPQDGVLELDLDIYTYGENLDLAIYTDKEMTQLVSKSIGPNHHDSSFEHITIDVLEGEEYFVKVYAPTPGNSTSYRLRADIVYEYLTVEGENLAPGTIVHGGESIPFLKLVLSAGSLVTLDEIIVTKHGTLPNPNWAVSRLYLDSNGDCIPDDNELIAEEIPQATNRVRMSNLGVELDYSEPLVLLVCTDISKSDEGYTIGYSLESYRDVSTVEGVEAHYTDFPITSLITGILADDDPPVWESTTGIQTVESRWLSVNLGWNRAIDLLSEPVRYNIYYTKNLPFYIEAAKKVVVENPDMGTDTDYQFWLKNLPDGSERHFVIRAEDHWGNEEDNFIMMSCTPVSDPDPLVPVYADYIDFNGYDIRIQNDLVLISNGSVLRIYENGGPGNYGFISDLNEPIRYLASGDGDYIYCTARMGGSDQLLVVDIGNPVNPLVTDVLDMGNLYQMKLTATGDYVFLLKCPEYGELLELMPVNVSDPYNVVPGTAIGLENGSVCNLIVDQGNRLYIALNYHGVLSVDITSPDSPQLTGSFGEPAIRDVYIEGSTLYALSVAYVQIYDVGADPDNPPGLGYIEYDLYSGNNYVLTLNDLLFVSRDSYSEYIPYFNVTDPQNPDELGQIDLPDASRLATDGEVVFITTSYTGVHVFM